MARRAARAAGPPAAAPAAARTFAWDDHFALPFRKDRLDRLVRQGWEDYLAVYAWFLGLQLIDLFTTFAVLSLGGIEANPFAAAVYEAHGAWGMVALKVLLIALTALVWVPAVAWVAQRPVERDGWALTILNGLVLCAVVYYSLVVVLNLANLSTLLARL